MKFRKPKAEAVRIRISLMKKTKKFIVDTIKEVLAESQKE